MYKGNTGIWGSNPETSSKIGDGLVETKTKQDFEATIWNATFASMIFDDWKILEFFATHGKP